MFSNLQQLRDFEDSCLTKIINKNGNELTPAEITQIKAVYTSNESTENWWQQTRMTKQKYTFSLFKIGDTIVGVSGMDHEDLEIRDDAVHKDFQNRGIYKRLMKHTNDWLKRNTIDVMGNNIPYYLFTEKTRYPDENRKKILNHINSGLVLLDRSTKGSNTYTSSVNGQTYTGLGGADYLVFRTPGNHNINFVTYNARQGFCSGIYIGNGIILTADHCDRDDVADFTKAKLTVNELNFNNKPGLQKRIEVTPATTEFIRNPGRDRTLPLGKMDAYTPDFTFIKLHQNDVNKFNHDMEIIPLLQDNLTIHKEDKSDRSYYTYGANSAEIRKTNINKFNKDKIGHHFFQNNISENLIGETFIDTLNNYKTKLNCVGVISGRNLSPGDSGGPHFYIKNETGQIVYLGPTGTQLHPHCLNHQDVAISAVYQHMGFIKDNAPGITNLLIYNLERDTFLFE